MRELGRGSREGSGRVTTFTWHHLRIVVGPQSCEALRLMRGALVDIVSNI